MAINTYGDISPERAGFLSVALLDRAAPPMVFEKVAQPHVLPDKSTKIINFTRFNSLPAITSPAVEGVTPESQSVSQTVIPITMQQLVSIVTITDVLDETHPLPVASEIVDIMAEQAALSFETERFNTAKAGTNVIYSNGAARTDVNTAISIANLRRCVRSLKRQNAKPKTKVVRSTPDFGRTNIPPAFIAICHPDLEYDFRALGASFIPAESYGQLSPFESEIGSVEGIRILLSTVCVPWANGGGDKGLMLSTTGVKADVYPVLIFGENAFATVAFKGKNAVVPTVIAPNKPEKSDPAGQRGHVSWKAMHKSGILNDAWMIRLEVAATA